MTHERIELELILHLLLLLHGCELSLKVRMLCLTCQTSSSVYRQVILSFADHSICVTLALTASAIFSVAFHLLKCFFVRLFNELLRKLSEVLVV